MKIQLTAPWRNTPPGAILEVTPGQRAMIIALEKGTDAPDQPDAETSETIDPVYEGEF